MNETTAVAKFISDEMPFFYFNQHDNCWQLIFPSKSLRGYQYQQERVIDENYDPFADYEDEGEL